MTTCVHCGLPRGDHCYGSQIKMACPIHNEHGHRIGWHPTNRFTPRSEEHLAGDGLHRKEGDPAGKGEVVQPAGIFTSPAAANSRSEEQVMSEKPCYCNSYSSEPCPRHPNEQLKLPVAMSEYDNLHKLHASLPDACPTCGHMEAPQPALTAGPQPGASGYCPHGYAVAANCGECFAERKQRDEDEKQKALAAGDHRQMLIAACRKAFEAIDAIPHGQTIKPSSTRHALREAWLACRDALQDIRTVEVEHTQPCPHCAGLERERDDIYQSHLILERRINELIKERDTLQAKVAELEKQNSALMTSMNEASKFALELEKNQAARIVALEAALRFGLRMNFARSDRKPEHQLQEFKEQANAALAGGKP